LKFSGKERDTESGLDYFGARYYDHTLYRFISIDPLIAKGASLMALQSWNGYSYCQNNPIGRIEIQGLFSLKITVENVYRVRSGDMTPVGAFPCNKLGLTLLTGGQITPYPGSNGKMALAFELKFDVYILEDSQLESLGKDAKSVWVHEISCHVHFVSQWITLSLGRIEKKWQKEMMEDPDKALQNAYKRLEAASRTAERLSRILFDDELSGILERLYRYMEEINSYWIPWRSDPLMAWVLNVPYCI
jgi:RHS repeat-associated protein